MLKNGIQVSKKSNILESNDDYSQFYAQLSFLEEEFLYGDTSDAESESSIEDREYSVNGRSYSLIPDSITFNDIIPETFSINIKSRLAGLKKNQYTKQRKQKLFSCITKEQKQRLERIKREIRNKEVIQLPKIEKQAGIQTNIHNKPIYLSFTKNDIYKKLDEQADLNDTILEDGLKILINYYFHEEKISTTSTFLMGELVTERFWGSNSRMTVQLEKEMYENIDKKYEKLKNKWLKKINIFGLQYLIVPVNSHKKHWNVMIIIQPRSLLEENHECRILLLDSLFQMYEAYPKAFRYFLCHTLHEQFKIEINPETIPIYQMLLPRQNNMHDCGVYSLLYVEYLLKNRKSILEADLSIPKNRENLKLFPMSLPIMMRRLLKRLFCQLTHFKGHEQAYKQFQHAKRRIIQQAGDNDYDSINQEKFQQYKRLYGYIQSQSSDKSPEELEFCLRMKFYLDDDIIYFQRQKHVYVTLDPVN